MKAEGMNKRKVNVKFWMLIEVHLIEETKRDSNI